MTARSDAPVDKDPTRNRFPFRFVFESFGVVIEFESNSERIIATFQELLPPLLANNYQLCAAPREHLITYEWSEDEFDSLYENGDWVYIRRARDELVPILASRIRLKVAEFATDRVFVHAGVVAIDDKAIIIPGRSLSGKTTLVAELVRIGAIYYSDEYAVIDDKGLVHPFAKPLSVRRIGEQEQTDFDVAEFGGTSGSTPIPIGMFLFSKYVPAAKWKPQYLPRTQAILEIIKDTIPIRQNPAFTLSVLDRAVACAMLVKTKRNEAADTAPKILSELAKTS